MLNRCIKLASKLENKKQRIFSIITDKHGKIIGSGGNSYSKTHPTMAYYAEKVGDINKIFLHSEISALVNCKSKPENMYIARVSRDGQPVKVSPCPICKLAILDSGIKKVITT